MKEWKSKKKKEKKSIWNANVEMQTPKEMLWFFSSSLKNTVSTLRLKLVWKRVSKWSRRLKPSPGLTAHFWLVLQNDGNTNCLILVKYCVVYWLHVLSDRRGQWYVGFFFAWSSSAKPGHQQTWRLIRKGFRSRRDAATDLKSPNSPSLLLIYLLLFVEVNERFSLEFHVSLFIFFCVVSE